MQICAALCAQQSLKTYARDDKQPSMQSKAPFYLTQPFVCLFVCYLIKASSVRALGVFVQYPCLRDDVLFVADTANAVLTAMTDAKIMVRMKAAWSLANVSDSLVTNM